jgi:hypothetical protein
MFVSLAKSAAGAAVALAVFVSPSFACDKAASADRISGAVKSGDVQRPTRVSEGFAVEVSEKFWKSADDKRKQELAADVACAIGTETVSFTRDRDILKTYRGGKPQ